MSGLEIDISARPSGIDASINYRLGVARGVMHNSLRLDGSPPHAAMPGTYVSARAYDVAT